MSQQALTISTVFAALSKPATLWGVDYNYFMVALVVVMLAFIYSGNFLAFLLFAPLHVIGWILHRIDPHMFKLIGLRPILGRSTNKKLWGCQTYEAN